MATASILAIVLIVYCLYLVASLSNKATSVFGEETLEGSETRSFDFAAYDRLVLRLYPGNTNLLSSMVVPVASVAIPDVASSSATTTSSTPATP